MRIKKKIKLILPARTEKVCSGGPAFQEAGYPTEQTAAADGSFNLNQ
jgi:hypothetical protein